MKRIPRSPGSQGNWAGGRRRHPPSEVATNEDQELKSALNCEADGLGAGADFAFVPFPDIAARAMIRRGQRKLSADTRTHAVIAQEAVCGGSRRTSTTASILVEAENDAKAHGGAPDESSGFSPTDN